MTPYRCVGTLNGPAGDCLLPVAGAVFCYGYVDLDQGRPLTSSLEGPIPMLYPVCERHRVALVDWAQFLWGEVADGMWVPREAIQRTLAWMEADGDPVYISPDPATAVRIAV